MASVPGLETCQTGRAFLERCSYHPQDKQKIPSLVWARSMAAHEQSVFLPQGLKAGWGGTEGRCVQASGAGFAIFRRCTREQKLIRTPP